MILPTGWHMSFAASASGLSALCTVEGKAASVQLFHMEAKFLEQLPVVEIRQNIVQVTETFRALAYRSRIPWIRARSCSVLFCFAEEVSKQSDSPHPIFTGGCRRSLFINILPTNSKPFLHADLMRRTSSRSVFVADFSMSSESCKVFERHLKTVL